ncbi:MAG: hypothetical protein ACFFAN_07360 [Promethearchaeota archaeon]
MSCSMAPSSLLATTTTSSIPSRSTSPNAGEEPKVPTGSPA